MRVHEPLHWPPNAVSVRTLSSVVFPAPEGPRMAMTLPDVAMPVISVRMAFFPCFEVTEKSIDLKTSVFLPPADAGWGGGAGVAISAREVERVGGSVV